MKIEINVKELAEAIAKAMIALQGGADNDKTSKKEAPEERGMSLNEVKRLHKEAVAETSAKEVKALLAVFGVKSVKDLDEDDYEDFAEGLEELLGLKKLLGDDDGDEDDDDAVTLEMMKKAHTAAKKEDKDEVTEIMEDYEVKTVSAAMKMPAEDIAELYADLKELADG